ncbi:hypothetical protein Q0M94_28165 (plasmid) [Deinococcus radiomollis]|uniref:hypothetical protein n=1 Tax=Deinococcus radiomollis TaxID=468916 RepID=UPI003891309C
MTAALDFLGSHPEAQITLDSASPEHRLHMLEDVTTALSFLAGHSWPNTSATQRAALEVFELAAAVWREYLLTFPGVFDPDRAALNLHAWASTQASNTEALPVGTATAWRAVRDLAAMTASPGYVDGEPEDLIDAALTSLEGDTARVLN